MAFNFKNLKAPGIPKVATRVAKIVTAKIPKSPSKTKIKVLKDKVSKSFDFSKMTKLAKLPKQKKITLIKKVIKEKKNVGF